MHLEGSQLRRLQQDGFLVLPGLFAEDEVAALRARLPALFAETHPANVVEKRSGEVRTAMALHQRDPLFAKLCRSPRLVGPARQIRPGPLYIQQVKVNLKAAFGGEPWQWHYDFATHHADDGVPRPDALNLHVFLDDVTEHNGPLYFIPGSHRHGEHGAWHDTESTSYPLWVVDEDVVARLVGEAQAMDPARGIVSATGPRGTGLVFFDTLVHGSPANMSPFDRAIFSLILNPVDNAQTTFSRPGHKHHTDFSDVIPVAAENDKKHRAHNANPAGK